MSDLLDSKKSPTPESSPNIPVQRPIDAAQTAHNSAETAKTSLIGQVSKKIKTYAKTAENNAYKLTANIEESELETFDWKSDFVTLAILEEMKRVAVIMTKSGWNTGNGVYSEWVWGNFSTSPLYNQMQQQHPIANNKSFISLWNNGISGNGTENFKNEFINKINELEKE